MRLTLAVATPDAWSAKHEGRESAKAPVRSPITTEMCATRAAEPRAPVVLVAEDNEINWAVAKALLARHGVRSALARDGAQAVRMIKEADYAAVLMDCQMPALDGYEATARIRASEGDRRVPIVAMTARTGPGERERCLAAGMDDYLPKPIRVEDLAAVIARWISRSQPTRADVARAASNARNARLA